MRSTRESLKMGLMPEEFRAHLASFSPPEEVDDFIDVVELLPVASKQGQVSGSEMRATALAEVERATTYYQISLAIADSRRASPRSDFLRQFRDLRDWPTKRRLLNILERDKDENNLRPAESALHFAILQLATFGDDIPPDWVERVGSCPTLLQKVAGTVDEHFAHRIDNRGRPRDTVLGTYADRLVQIYEALTGRPITYSKATENSRGRQPGEPYGPGLDFMLTGLRLVDSDCTAYQAGAQLDRIRRTRR